MELVGGVDTGVRSAYARVIVATRNQEDEREGSPKLCSTH
jgi:hypothetical protein